MIETIDEVVMEGRKSRSYSGSDSSTRSHSNKYTSSTRGSNTMNRRPTSVKETKPVYNNDNNNNNNNNGTIDVNPFESSSSTLGAHGAGQQKSQNELILRINQNRGATIDNFMDFFSKEVFKIVLHRTP